MVRGAQATGAVEFDYRVVNRNGAIEDAVREIDAIIAAEKCRVNPRLVQML